MSDNSILPKAQSQLVDQAGRPTRAFYNFFNALVSQFQGQINTIKDVVAKLTAVIAALGGDAGDLPDIPAMIAGKADKTTTIAGIQSIQGGGDLSGDRFFMLAGDMEAPPALSFYGALFAETKGWQTFSGNFTALDNGDGTYALDLSELADAGGGSLQRTAFDAYGRKTGTSAATTTDLNEGSNLYFTDERAQDAIGAALDGTGDVPLSYDDAGNMISAALASGVLASLALADSATQPGDLATVATTGAYADLSGLPTLGTAAATAATDYATAAQGAKADSAVQSVVAGTGVSVDNTNPQNPVISATGAGSGDVAGPASAVDGDLALFDGITGKLIKSGGALNKAAVGLGNADNTSDVNKPVSTAQQAAMNAMSFKNRLINGDFAINQRAFAGGALADGVYGFDRWKAGTGGCNVSLSSGMLTHTSGPLVQIMEAPGLASTTVTVSVEDPSGSISVDVDGVTGTIASGSGRRGVSIAIPSGSTGNVTLKLTATGVTYRRVQLEVGSVSTAWDTRSKTSELMQCFRYYWRGVPNGSGINTNTYASAYQSFIVAFHVRMRAIPAASGTGIVVGTPFDPTYSGVGYALAPSVDGFRILGHSTAAGVNANFIWDSNAITSYFEMDAEL